MGSHLILVLGQSNAMNYGTLSLAFPGGWTPDPGIQIWNSTAFVTYDPGVNSNGMDASTTWGPEAEYARQWRVRNPDETLYIFKLAWGGTGDGVAAKPLGTYDWNVDSLASDQPYKMFPRMYTGVVNCANLLYTVDGTVNIDTILYCGTETDTVLQADADACYTNLLAVITGIRGQFQRPNARCVLSRPFPNATQGAYLNTVRAAVEAVGSLYNNAYVSLDGLEESVPRPGHLTPAATVTMGSLMFAADLNLIATYNAQADASLSSSSRAFDGNAFDPNAFDADTWNVRTTDVEIWTPQPVL